MEVSSEALALKSRRRSWLLFSMLGISAVLLLGWVLLLVTLGGRIDRYRPEIEKAISQRVGGEVTFGNFGLTIFSGWKFAPGITSGYFVCRDPLRGEWCEGEGFELRVTSFPDLWALAQGRQLTFTESAEFTIKLDNARFNGSGDNRVKDLDVDLVINGVGVVSRWQGAGHVHYRSSSWLIDGPLRGEGSFEFREGLQWKASLVGDVTRISYLKLIDKGVDTPLHFQGSGLLELQKLRLDEAQISAPFGQVAVSGVVDLLPTGPRLSLKVDTVKAALKDWQSFFPWELGPAYPSQTKITGGTLSGQWMLRGPADDLTCEGQAEVQELVLDPAPGSTPFTGAADFKGREVMWRQVSSGYLADQRFTWVGEQVRFPFIPDPILSP